VKDASRFKIAVKAAQIGYSFAAALEAVLDCLEHRTLWIVLSRGERQSLEFMQKVQLHAKALRIAGSEMETSFFETASVTQHEVAFPNGSRIIGLPANPDTARGYTGNMILDEFAFHQHDREIWAAAFGRISRGDLKLRVLSTPNGQRGKYYELAKEAGLTEVSGEWRVVSGESGKSFPSTHYSPLTTHLAAFSPHWCDVHAAVGQGCPIHIETLRQAIGDEQTWRQEYECAFLAGSENYISMSLIAACEDAEASTALPPDWAYARAGRECYFGYDVGRVRDLAVLAIVEKLGDVFWTRALVEMSRATFALQEKVLSDLIPLCRRGSLDATGMGMEMAERLAAKFPGKVEPVAFTAAVKHEMALRMKRHFEERTVRIPDHQPLRRDLNAVKRLITAAGNIRFDAERTEAGHADRFWALALALQSAERGVVAAASAGIESDEEWYPSRDRKGAVSATEEGDPSLAVGALIRLESGGFPWA
jgi:phage FluMu gp28-like protein